MGDVGQRLAAAIGWDPGAMPSLDAADSDVLARLLDGVSSRLAAIQSLRRWRQLTERIDQLGDALDALDKTPLHLAAGTVAVERGKLWDAMIEDRRKALEQRGQVSVPWDELGLEEHDGEVDPIPPHEGDDTPTT